MQGALLEDGLGLEGRVRAPEDPLELPRVLSDVATALGATWWLDLPDDAFDIRCKNLGAAARRRALRWLRSGRFASR